MWGAAARRLESAGLPKPPGSLGSSVSSRAAAKIAIEHGLL
jgi:hypothetical protein